MHQVELEAIGEWYGEWDERDRGGLTYFSGGLCAPLVKCSCCGDGPTEPDADELYQVFVGIEDIPAPAFKYSMWTLDGGSYLCEPCYEGGERLEEQ